MIRVLGFAWTWLHQGFKRCAADAHRAGDFARIEPPIGNPTPDSAVGDFHQRGRFFNGE
jgi:hypothetical protein